MPKIEIDAHPREKQILNTILETVRSQITDSAIMDQNSSLSTSTVSISQDSDDENKSLKS